MTEHSADVPQHIGLILDGNRRWARERNLPTLQGHNKGYDNLRTILDAAIDRGVQYVSAFIFSTENWSRTEEEVGYLMDLALRMVVRDIKEIHKKNIRVVWIGSEDRVSDKLKKAIRDAEELTKDNTAGTLGLCFNYGGQREIIEGVRRLIADGIQPADLTEKVLSGYLYHPEVPPIDLLIRTSGEQRISNFMLWRAAYSELYFSDKYWPDFSVSDLDAAFTEYNQRGRRFGG